MSLFGVADDAGPLRLLDDRRHRTLRSVARTVLGSALDFDADIATSFDGYLANEPADVISDLQDALTWLELGPVFYEHRWTIFSDLSANDREAHFRSWMESDDQTRRMVATALRKFVNLVCYDNPSTWARIQYPGPATGLRT